MAISHRLLAKKHDEWKKKMGIYFVVPWNCCIFAWKNQSIMKATEQTSQQIERTIRKIAQKMPSSEQASLFTDIHLRVTQESGELVAFDDEDQEITRCVIEQWIDNKDENFYDEVAAVLRKELHRVHDMAGNLGVVKPYSFVLENDDKESLAELFVADDDTVIIGGDLMEGLDKELDDFFDDLMKEA